VRYWSLRLGVPLIASPWSSWLGVLLIGLFCALFFSLPTRAILIDYHTASQHLSLWLGHIPIHCLPQHELSFPFVRYHMNRHIKASSEFNDKMWIKYEQVSLWLRTSDRWLLEESLEVSSCLIRYIALCKLYYLSLLLKTNWLLHRAVYAAWETWYACAMVHDTAILMQWTAWQTITTQPA